MHVLYVLCDVLYTCENSHFFSPLFVLTRVQYRTGGTVRTVLYVGSWWSATELIASIQAAILHSCCSPQSGLKMRHERKKRAQGKKLEDANGTLYRLKCVQMSSKRLIFVLAVWAKALSWTTVIIASCEVSAAAGNNNIPPPPPPDDFRYPLLNGGQGHQRQDSRDLEGYDLQYYPKYGRERDPATYSASNRWDNRTRAPQPPVRPERGETAADYESSRESTADYRNNQRQPIRPASLQGTGQYYPDAKRKHGPQLPQTVGGKVPQSERLNFQDRTPIHYQFPSGTEGLPAKGERILRDGDRDDAAAEEPGADVNEYNDRSKRRRPQEFASPRRDVITAYISTKTGRAIVTASASVVGMGVGAFVGKVG